MVTENDSHILSYSEARSLESGGQAVSALETSGKDPSCLFEPLWSQVFLETASFQPLLHIYGIFCVSEPPSP